jgi:hypothetical protein
MDRFRGWVRAHPIAWMVGILVIGGIIGVAAGSSGESELKDEKADLEERVASMGESLDSAQEDQEDAEKEAELVLDERRQIIVAAQGKAGHIVGKAKDEAAELDDVRSEITSAEDELASVESSLEGAQEEEAKSTIPGNGTFQSEVDYIPGTYKSDGGGSCYWATLNSADPYDISSNENASGPTIASITTPYFQTQGCGEWTRVGE